MKLLKPKFLWYSIEKKIQKIELRVANLISQGQIKADDKKIN